MHRFIGMQTKTTTLLLIFLAFQLEYAPAQIFQYSEQKGIWNEFTDALWLNDSTFVASEVIMSGGLTTASLSAFNPAGEIIWTLATPDTLEIMAYHSLIDRSELLHAVRTTAARRPINLIVCKRYMTG